MSEVAQKWGDAVAGRGFSQVPNYLLFINQFIDKENHLSPLELLLLVQLSGSWWKRDAVSVNADPVDPLWNVGAAGATRNFTLGGSDPAQACKAPKQRPDCV